MKNLLFIVFLFSLSFSISAQSYMTAGGLRAGTDWGITIQQRIAKKWTAEGILQSSLQRGRIDADRFG